LSDLLDFIAGFPGLNMSNYNVDDVCELNAWGIDVSKLSDAVRLSRSAPVATCVCKEPSTPNTVHRTDGPCYVNEVAQPVDGEAGDQDRDAKIKSALSIIRQDYSKDCLAMASVREYVEDAIQQLIDAGYSNLSAPSEPKERDKVELSIELANKVERLVRIACNAAGKLNATNPTGLFSSLEIETLASSELDFVKAIEAICKARSAKEDANA
jgi:hypothetical protein